MFTGIVQGLAKIEAVESTPGRKHISVLLGPDLITGLKIGASVAIDGVCLTVVSIDGDLAAFDVIQETLDRTTLNDIHAGRQVNIERAAKFGDEIGGHLLSGHIYDYTPIENVERSHNNVVMTFSGKAPWMKYLFPKGYVAIDGVSLTLVDVNPDKKTFSVHLIPETLRVTTLGRKHAGDKVNIEIDAQTQAIVDTVERIDGRSALYDRPA